MTEPEPEWELPVPPPPPGVDLEAGELLLIDWVLCGASHIVQNYDLDELVMRWHDLRILVWCGLKALADARPKAITQFRYELRQADAETLLALVPTTHRWGTGPDVGYSLKLKLSVFLGVGQSQVIEVATAEPEKPVYLDD
jgi:hypothetical protein